MSSFMFVVSNSFLSKSSIKALEDELHTCTNRCRALESKLNVSSSRFDMDMYTGTKDSIPRLHEELYRRYKDLVEQSGIKYD